MILFVSVVMFHSNSLELIYSSSIAAFLLCVHPVVSLIGTFCSCSFATNEYKNISSALHKLSSSGFTDNSVLLRQVESFSLQLMTTKMQFTAKGFFEISNKTLREVKNNQFANCCLRFELIFFCCRRCQHLWHIFWLPFSSCQSGTFSKRLTNWIKKDRKNKGFESFPRL